MLEVIERPVAARVQQSERAFARGAYLLGPVGLPVTRGQSRCARAECEIQLAARPRKAKLNQKPANVVAGFFRLPRPQASLPATDWILVTGHSVSGRQISGLTVIEPSGMKMHRRQFQFISAFEPG